MRILILATSFSGLCQRVQRELMILGHTIDEHYDLEPSRLRQQIAGLRPDLIICPFLTQRIPEDIWQNTRCLIVHPGIEGDRGPSSLDWAISHNAHTWGATLLQADREMDMGDIWATQNFKLRQASKTSIYKREVTSAAIKMLKQALKAVETNKTIARALDYSNTDVKGRLQPPIKKANRTIHWHSDSTAAVMQKLFAADTNPGVAEELYGYDVKLFGAREELTLRGDPGEVLAVHKGSICRATIDGAVWIRQLKCLNHPNLPPIKLPANIVFTTLLGQRNTKPLSTIHGASAADEVYIQIDGDISYVYFDFYNGAANTAQCVELKNQLVALKNTTVKCIVLMGGEDFWSNGIHLNCIEAAPDPARESWLNINAIDDVVREIIDCPNQITIAALRNNAGAGGAIMALACDKVWIRDGVVLNPHYNTMGLYGSEYWTYLLPRRCGEQEALNITKNCMPMLAIEAFNEGLADEVMPEDWKTYHTQLEKQCKELTLKTNLKQFLAQKATSRARDEAVKPLLHYRKEELFRMKKTFDDPNSCYHSKRHAFVYKLKAEASDTVTSNALTSEG